MDNYLLNDLVDISVKYMNTETYGKLKKVFPEIFDDEKKEELNLLCDVPYELFIKLAKVYSSVKQNMGKSKINLLDLIYIVDCSLTLKLQIESFYEKFADLTFMRDVINKQGLSNFKYVKFCKDSNNGQFISVLYRIREKILKNEPDINETTNPLGYREIIAKYFDQELIEMGYNSDYDED
jgi:hypothetical protein